MKVDERIEARRLRKEGESIGEIARRVGVSKGTVSVWVKNIELNEFQKAELQLRNPIFNGQFKAAKERREKYREIRDGYQQEGRKKARENEPLHLMGCMLYWAEGNKEKNSLVFSNSDACMIKVFFNFLVKCCFVNLEKIKLRIQCYTDKNKTVEEIENYWLSLLGLSRSNLNKTTANYDSRGKRSIRKKHIYGICSLVVNNTRIVQNIFGAIQEYSGLDNHLWRDAEYGSYQHEE